MASQSCGMMIAAVSPQRTSVIENMRVVGRDHHIAGGNDAGAAAEAAALHQRHRRDRQQVQPLHRLEGRRETASFSSADCGRTALIHFRSAPA